jgi:hypothetical protein
MGFEVTFSPTSLRKSGENSIIFYIYRGNPWGICVDFLLVLARQALRLSSLLRGSRSILRGFSVDFAWILGRFCVDSRSILGRFSVDSRSILGRFCVDFFSSF